MFPGRLTGRITNINGRRWLLLPPYSISKMKFSRKIYFSAFLILLLIECLIALYIHDKFIRPYFGDFLVVILIYCFLMTTFNTTCRQALWISILVAFAVEFSQYFGLIYYLSDAPPAILKIILGSSYSTLDLIAYSCGILCVWLIESVTSRIRGSFRIF